MARNPLHTISPPLLNSSNPWATTPHDLLRLYLSPSTGAITTRTSLLNNGFTQHPTTHQYTFFNPSTGHTTSKINTSGLEGRGEVLPGETSSLNNLGYSPFPFEEYLETIIGFGRDGLLTRDGPVKPFIVSVTGTAEEVREMYGRLVQVQRGDLNHTSFALDDREEGQQHSPRESGLKLMMEINLSCPNIPNKPPPAYDGASLKEYIIEIYNVQRRMGVDPSFVPVGIKTPPYTYSGQFQTLIEVLETTAFGESGYDLSSRIDTRGKVKGEMGKGVTTSDAETKLETIHPPPTTTTSLSLHPISFITATNTLGSCFVPQAPVTFPTTFNTTTTFTKPALGQDTTSTSTSNSGIGGMGGTAIHTLSLGNVKTIRNMLNASRFASVRGIGIIGVGGVSDRGGFERMRGCGADVVGVGTAFGRGGEGVFEEILRGGE